MLSVVIIIYTYIIENKPFEPKSSQLEFKFKQAKPSWLDFTTVSSRASPVCKRVAFEQAI